VIGAGAARPMHLAAGGACTFCGSPALDARFAAASERNSSWTIDAASIGLVGASLAAPARWLRNP
jgi:hypothetical protein